MSQQSYLQMTKDLVDQQIQTHMVSEGEVVPLLNATFAALVKLERGDAAFSVTTGQQAVVGAPQPASGGWRKSMTRHSIACIECGATFKQLSARHLSTHDLTPRSYRVKHGIPSKQSLSAREVTVRRRALAKEIRPWELARKKRSDARKVTPRTKKS